MTFFIFKTITLLSCISFVFAWYPSVDGIREDHGYREAHDGLEHSSGFLNEWTVHVDGGEEIAQLVALELGYEFGGPVLGFPDTYVFVKYSHAMQRRTPAQQTDTLVNDRRVRWAQQLFTKSRVKRYVTPGPDEELHRVRRVEKYNNTRNRTRRAIVERKPLFNDDLWTRQWYMQDTRTEPDLPRLDLNVLPVYAMGFTGAGVRVSVLDDGIEHNHTDLRDNYDSSISWDCNDRDSDPSPRYDEHNRNSHGTRCAGEIAMTANNHKCGVGVAWGAKIGGIRMLDGRITDRIEGEAIGYAWDKVDVYSASWGPNDDGRTVEGPGRLAIEALKRGITKGRNGKGSIYVWANGNGGGHNDNCNCDGYSSSIYTVSIGSASQHGLFPWYGEVCSSTLATAYSSGAYTDQKIATTDTKDSCTLGHTGTSAAAPLAAGIIALALQANPNLTWRDVQHLIAWTSEYAPLSANPGWQRNRIGLWFDIRFGFGLLNAGSLVLTALNWTNVPEKQTCRVEATPLGKTEARISPKIPLEMEIDVTECNVNFLEHVELKLNLAYTRRGAIEINLISPQGTKVQVLSPRPRDTSTAGFVNWPLMSVATWGENPHGTWTIIVEDRTDEENSGEIGPIALLLHGTSEMPNHMKNGPRQYNKDYNKYQEVFKYFEDFLDKDVWKNTQIDADSDNIAEWNNEANLDNEATTAILDEVEKELQRIHHGKIYKSAGFGI